MKADDYAQIYRGADTRNDGLIKVGVAFIQETGQIVRERKIGKSNSTALKAVIKEQSDKWKAFVRRVDDRIKEDGYIIIMRNEFPEIADEI